MVEHGSGRVVLLASRVSDDDPIAPGSPILYANDVDILGDGSVLFTDSGNLGPAPGRGSTMRGFMLLRLQACTPARISVLIWVVTAHSSPQAVIMMLCSAKQSEGISIYAAGMTVIVCTGRAVWAAA